MLHNPEALEAPDPITQEVGEHARSSVYLGATAAGQMALVLGFLIYIRGLAIGPALTEPIARLKAGLSRSGSEA